MNNIEVLDRNALNFEGVNISERLASFNKAFDTKITPENGYYGIRRVDAGNGLEKIFGKTAAGHSYIEYYQNGILSTKRVSLGDKQSIKTEYSYDDTGQNYLKTISETGKPTKYEFTPNTTIKKGNFTAQTDAYGRVISTKMTDVSINQGTRKEVTGLKDSTYKTERDVGHGVPARLNGPGTKENTYAQYKAVNRGKIKRVENIAVKLKQEGHTVDYEMKANYGGTRNTEPTSFEPHITVDGKEYIFEGDNADLKKIYNTKDDFVHKTVTQAKERFGTANEIGMKSGLVAAGITCAISSMDYIGQCVNGEITGEEAAANIVKETAAAGGIAYGTAFVSVAVSETMKGSSKVLLQQVGSSCLPVAVASFAVDSCDSVMNYAKGEIDGTELAYELGDSAVMVAGGIEGAKIGAAVGTAIVAGAGTVAGGIVGGVVGTVVASAAYTTAVDLGAEGIEYLGEQVELMAKETVDLFEENIPELMDSAKVAFNDFFNSCNLPFAV